MANVRSTPDEARFLKDVAEHRMTVLRDDGVHRHLQFRKPGTWCMGFEIVTFPGALVYTGDMGCYVFRRLEDMFEFFRTDRAHGEPGRRLYINRSYWAEKVVAQDRDGVMKYSPEKFIESAKRWPENSFESVPRKLLKAIDEEIVPHAHEEHDARQAVQDFEHDGYTFQDFWEADLRDYTYRFVWCCYALAWSIEQYDKAKEPAHA